MTTSRPRNIFTSLNNGECNIDVIVQDVKETKLSAARIINVAVCSKSEKRLCKQKSGGFSSAQLTNILPPVTVKQQGSMMHFHKCHLYSTRASMQNVSSVSNSSVSSFFNI